MYILCRPTLLIIVFVYTGIYFYCCKRLENMFFDTNHTVKAKIFFHDSSNDYLKKTLSHFWKNIPDLLPFSLFRKDLETN